MKLYYSTKHTGTWFAFSHETGWVMFPATFGGWEKRLAARGLDPLAVREVPITQGFNTGIPGAAGAEATAARAKKMTTKIASA